MKLTPLPVPTLAGMWQNKTCPEVSKPPMAPLQMPTLAGMWQKQNLTLRFFFGGFLYWRDPQ